ncbi:flagellar assembly protein FliH [Aestuariibacter salexigens]|uniref:flagellar assembly protein FliH n=1 Tax=Aestuariibacter salexigens TaxID=226010 RepID=UPI0004217C23|nr:flagellar assembly protein FliH [Aestuariibacter salexigens]
MSSSSEQKSKVVAWQYPFVESADAQDDSRTNAFNKRSDWKYEPPEEEVEPVPPTAEEIEAIRQAAHEEGFAEGKQTGYQEGLQNGHKEGFDQGHQEGLENGYAEGFEKGSEDVQARVSQWQDMLDTLHQPLQHLERDVQRELVELAVVLARSVINVEVQHNSEILLQALSEGLKALPVNETLYQIHLHPDDLALVNAHFSEEEIEKHHWQFIESPNMSRGGCDITTQNNAVDVSIERRCREVLDKFLLEQGLKTK